MQITKRNTAVVQLTQRHVNAVSNAVRPITVDGKFSLDCIESDERTAGNHGIHKCLALYIFLNKVMMFPKGC
jgi:hypothetical protein